MSRVEVDARLPGLRVLTAPNPGLFTLAGTRVHIVGERDVAVIDPGPDDPSHLDRLAALIEGAERVSILLTHRHADHAAGVAGLAERVGRRLVPGDPSGATTDSGALTPIPTPGHSEDHMVFHWPEASAVFVGDVVLGEGDTTWLGEYRECVRDYLESLDRIQGLAARYLISAHGPIIDDPPAALKRFREHRLARIDQVRDAFAELPNASPLELTDHIYGTLPAALRSAAAQGVAVMLAFLEGR